MPKFIFQPGLKFECDYMRFFSPFDRAEISSPVSQTGLKFQPRNRHVIDPLPRNRPLSLYTSKPERVIYH